MKAGDGDGSRERGTEPVQVSLPWVLQFWKRTCHNSSSTLGISLHPTCMKCFPISRHPLAQFTACQSAAGCQQSGTGFEHSLRCSQNTGVPGNSGFQQTPCPRVNEVGPITLSPITAIEAPQREPAILSSLQHKFLVITAVYSRADSPALGHFRGFCFIVSVG